MERAKGIEPSYAAWEAAVLPLNYARTTEPNILRTLFRLDHLILTTAQALSAKA